MSKIITGISCLALVIEAFIYGLYRIDVIELGSAFYTWLIVFGVLSIPFLMHLFGLIFLIVGALLLSPFVGLSQYDSDYEDEEEE